MPLPARRLLRSAVAILLALPLVAGSCAPATSADEIAADDLVARIEAGTAPLLLDVRTSEEFAGGHVPGAVNIPHDQLAKRIGEIESHRADEVVVYCERGGRAARAEGVLADAGFRQVRHLAGDMSAWRKAGRPTE